MLIPDKHIKNPGFESIEEESEVSEDDEFMVNDEIDDYNFGDFEREFPEDI